MGEREYAEIEDVDYMGLLNGPEGEDLRLRVKHGVRFFEDQGAYLWAHRIVEAVEANEFNMSCAGNCAVGTVLGSYLNHFSGHDDDGGAELGFWGYSTAEWAALEQAWVDAARAEVER